MENNVEKNYAILEDIFSKTYGMIGGDVKAYSNLIRNPYIPEQLREYINLDGNKIVIPIKEFNKKSEENFNIDENIFNLFKDVFVDFSKDVVEITPEILVKRRYTKDKNEYKLVKSILDYYSKKKRIVTKMREAIYTSVRVKAKNRISYDFFQKFPRKWRNEKTVYRSIEFIKLISDYLTYSYNILDASRGVNLSEDYHLVISWDIVDLALASTGNSFTSCMNFYANAKNTVFNEAGNKNRAVIYLTDGRKKNEFGLEGFSMISRTHAFLGNETETGYNYYYMPKMYGSNTIEQFITVLRWYIPEEKFKFIRGPLVIEENETKNKYRAKFPLDFSFLPKYFFEISYFDNSSVEQYGSRQIKEKFFDKFPKEKVVEKNTFNAELNSLFEEASRMNLYFRNSNGGFTNVRNNEYQKLPSEITGIERAGVEEVDKRISLLFNNKISFSGQNADLISKALDTATGRNGYYDLENSLNFRVSKGNHRYDFLFYQDKEDNNLLKLLGKMESRRNGYNQVFSPLTFEEYEAIMKEIFFEQKVDKSINLKTISSYKIRLGYGGLLDIVRSIDRYEAGQDFEQIILDKIMETTYVDLSLDNLPEEDLSRIEFIKLKEVGFKDNKYVIPVLYDKNMNYISKVYKDVEDVSATFSEIVEDNKKLLNMSNVKEKVEEFNNLIKENIEKKRIQYEARLDFERKEREYRDLAYNFRDKVQSEAMVDLCNVFSQAV